MEEVSLGKVLFSLAFLIPSLFFFWLKSSLDSISRIKLSGILWEREFPPEYTRLLEESIPIFSFFGNLFFLFFVGYFAYSFKFALYLELIIIGVLFMFFYIGVPSLVSSRFRMEGILVSLFLLPLIKPFIRVHKEETEEIEDEATEGEVEAFLEEGREENIIDEEEEEMLRNVIEFSDTIVREIMTPHSEIVAVPSEMSLREVSRIISREKKSRLPVYREFVDRIEGIVYAKDVVGYCFESGDKKVSEIMREAIFVPETLPISEAMKIMKDKKTKIAIAIDEYGGVSGLITMEDIVEEIVGEITEIDEEEEQEIWRGPRAISVRGDYDIEELEEKLGVEFPEGDYSTIAGFVMDHLGKIARRGEEFSYGGYRFKIADADRRSIKKVLIVKEEK